MSLSELIIYASGLAVVIYLADTLNVLNILGEIIARLS